MSEKRDPELEKVIHDYLDAFNSGRIDEVVAAFTEDAVHSPPIGPARVQGHRKLRQYFRQTFELNAPQISDYVLDYEILGDHAVIQESWRVTFHPAGKAAYSHPGQALWIARKVDGQWKTHWLMGKLVG